jgi:hypothetical protein
MMLSLITFLTLLTFSFLQVTLVVRRIDLALSSMIPSVFETALQPLVLDEETRFTFDHVALEEDINRHLKFQLDKTPLTYVIELTYFDQETFAPCLSACDAVVFQFRGVVMQSWELNRTTTLVIKDYEANND